MKLLMHMCCGPCSTYPASVLKEEGIPFEGFFFNPNIHPYEEYTLRKENVEKFAASSGIKVHYIDDFRQKAWESFSGGGAERCMMCYSLRLDMAARYASDNGFNAFTTSLLVSPYQKHELIKELGEKLASKYGIDFYYRDFRPGFRQGQEMARQLGLYRQKFCGCIISLAEANEMRKKKGKG